MPDPGELTVLLQSAAGGDADASQKLIDVIHRELKSVARARLANEHNAHTLQPTAVVNDVFLRLFHPAHTGSDQWMLNSMEIENRSHFRSIAAAQMRLLLIDYARARKAGKRDGVKIPLDELKQPGESRKRDIDPEDLEAHLTLLAGRDQRAAKVVELKFFGGMTDKEVAAAVDASVATVRRDWEFARGFLKIKMQKAGKPE